MTQDQSLSRNEKTLAALAHGSIILGPLTNGVGGVIAALVIWLTQKEKSEYVAGQALQALVYQAATTVISLLAWCCWTVLYLGLLFPPIIANPEAYQDAVPPSMWVGLALIAIPLLVWAVTIVYGIIGAIRTLGGHDFKYAIIGNWLEERH